MADISRSPSDRVGDTTVDRIQRITKIDEDAIYDAIAQELESGNKDQGLWIRLFAECDGDETRIKVAYIKKRAEKLLANERARIEALERERIEKENKAADIALGTGIEQSGDSIQDKPLSKRSNYVIRTNRLTRRLEAGDGTTLEYFERVIDAVRAGNTAAVREVLEYEEIYAAAKNDDNGNTLLHYAIAECNAEMIRLLIQYGAPTTLRNKYGLTPLDFAKDNPRLLEILYDEGAIEN